MIKIICVGKIKERYFLDALKEYEKRIGKYTKLEIIELPDYNYDTEKTIYEEGKNILSKILDKDYVICLDMSGKQYNSVDLSKKIYDKLSNNITFVIGGSFGLSNVVKQRANDIISFSPLTFPHKLFRVMLLEQIYRSFKIINNESYHK